MTTENRTHVDKEITMHTLSIHNFCSPTNAVSPIYRLPPELLASIFIRCAQDYHSNPNYFTLHLPTWVNVSYVCRYWRSVALGCPILWTYHFVTSQRWTEELLARSRKASLKLRIIRRFHKDKFWWASLVEKLMNHTERIEELHLDLPYHSIDQIFSKLSSRAPRLQHLKIEIQDRPSEWSSVFFDGDTPALRTLELSECSIPWYSLKLNGLTTLSLQNVPVRFQQNVADFLAVLSCMRDLRHLSLDHALLSAASFLSSTAFAIFQKINLPYLSRLLIVAPLSTVVALLSCVNIPPETEIRLRCKSEGESVDDYSLLSSLLAQRLYVSGGRGSSNPTICSFVINTTLSREVDLIFSISTRTCDLSIYGPYTEWDYNVPLQITIYWSRPIDIDRIIGDIYCSLPLMNVQNIHAINPRFSPTLWRKVLGHSRDLSYIKLSQGYMPDLAFVLSLPDLTAHEGMENQGGLASCDRDTDHILAPNLEKLELDRITFAAEVDSEPMEPAITKRSLFDALSSRDIQGGLLIMTQCDTEGHGRLDMTRSWDGKVDMRVFYESDSDSYSVDFEGYLDDDSDND